MQIRQDQDGSFSVWNGPWHTRNPHGEGLTREEAEALVAKELEEDEAFHARLMAGFEAARGRAPDSSAYDALFGRKTT
jgi:hypothetical protein